MQAIRVYLELTTPKQLRPGKPVPALRVCHLPAPQPEQYREFYRTVGEAYCWRDRWHWTDAEIARHLARPEISVYAAEESDRIVGWYELRRVPDDRSVEIAYLGLLPQAIGRGLGRALLGSAVDHAWAFGATRVWLHTCSLDHPHALPNYRARGFAAYRTESYDVDSPT
ncbi:MAG TPA: GNAT family N-acetyltransferase [Gemmatimonadales bacterium]|nr:GNAT family N-acetyltransferase [Gemmatimonadales bacterium]